MIFRRLANDSVIYGGADFLSKLFSFFTFPIIAAVLSPKIFGTLELILTSTALLGLIMNCGINNSVQRFYWDKNTGKNDQPTIVTAGFISQISLGIVAVVLVSLLIPFVITFPAVAELSLTSYTLFTALILMALSQWSQFILDVIRLHFTPWRFFSLALLSRVVSICFGLVAVVWLGLGLNGLLGAQILVLIVVCPIGLFMIRKDINLLRINLGWVKQLLQFGYPFIFAGLAFWLFGTMDRWMLASMSSVEETGTYSVAFRFASVVLFVSTAFGQAWSPFAMKIRKDHPASYATIYGYVLLLIVLLMTIVGGLVALFSGEVISLMMPPEYLSSALPLSILSFGVVLQSTLQVTAVGISLEKKTFIFARLSWLTAAINFVLNWVLIPMYGSSGAAISTFISYFVLTGCYFYFSQSLHPIVISYGRLFALLLLGSIVAITSLSMIANTIDWVIVGVKLLVGLVCLVIGLFTIPMSSIRKII